MKEKKLLILFFIYLLIKKDFLKNNFSNKKKILKSQRICIINLHNSQNVGNILVKFALSKKLKEFGLNPTIVAPRNNKGINISFLTKTTNLIVLNNNFTELNENDYDYIVVNSDQTWSKCDVHYFYDVAFLKFAENWKIPKFIYGASLGSDKWYYSNEEEQLAIKLLRNFTGISFREKGLVRLVEEHLGLKSEFVLDPTLIIDKNYYLNEIKNYKPNIKLSDEFIFVYQLDKNPDLEKIIKESSRKFNYKIYKHQLSKDDYIESFIFGINNSQAIITDSFHGTIFSIMFNKPFITFLNKVRGKGRFDSLIEVFNLENRIVDTSNNKTPDINLLSEPLHLNMTLFNGLKNFSIYYLKKNLNMIS